MGKVIAITNQKGGVGKTTTSVNLAASMAATQRNVLLIDLDPQGNATTACGIDKKAKSSGVYQLLIDDLPIEQVICKAPCGFDLIASNGETIAAEMALYDLTARERRLKNALESVVRHYQFIFIDCPPSLNLLTLNALSAADSVLIPVQCEYFALEGLASMVDTINNLSTAIHKTLPIEGIVRTMYDARNRLTQEVSEQLQAHFGDTLYQTVIPRNIRLAEAPSYGMPVMQYDKYSKGAKAYLLLAKEMLNRQ